MATTDNSLFRRMTATASGLVVLAGAVSQGLIIFELVSLGHPIWACLAIAGNVTPHVIIFVLFRPTGVEQICSRCSIHWYTRTATAIYTVFALPVVVVADFVLQLWFLGRVPTSAMMCDVMQLRQVLGVSASLLNTLLQGYILLQQRLGMDETPNVDWRLLTASFGTSVASILKTNHWLNKYASLKTNGSKLLLVKQMANFGESSVPGVLLTRVLGCRHVECYFDLQGCSPEALVTIGETVRKSEVVQALAFINSAWIRKWCLDYSDDLFCSSLLERILQNGAALEVISFDEALPEEVERYLSNKIDGHMSLRKVVAQGQDIAENGFLVHFDELAPVLQMAWLGDEKGIETALAEDDAAKDVHGRRGESACMIAASRGHVGIVKVMLLADLQQTSRRNMKGMTALTMAAIGGKLECVKILLAAGSEPEAQDHEGMTALMHACVRSHATAAEALLLKKADVMQCDLGGQLNVLHHTLLRHEDDVDLVRLLLRHAETSGPGLGSVQQIVNARTRRLTTPLMLAAQQGHVQASLQLIRSNAEVFAADRDGQSALHLATSKGRIDTVKMLLEHRASVNQQDVNGWTPLYNAAANGTHDLLKALLKHSAHVGISSHKGKTPVHVAAGRVASDAVSVKLVRGLLEARASARTKDKREGETPLLAALYAGNTNTAKLLIEFQAEVTCRNVFNLGALACMAKGGDTALLTFLLDKRCEIDALSNNGWSPLEWAIDGSHLAMVTALLKQRADPERPQISQNMTPSVALAARQGTTDIMSVLLSFRASINATDSFGFSPLHHALECDRYENALWLLEHRSDPSLVNMFGSGPLLWAAQRGHLDMAQALLKAQAEVNTEEHNGATPLEASLRSGREYEDVALELLAARADPHGTTLPRRPLYLAASNGMLRVVEQLLQLQADANAHQNMNLPLFGAVGSLHNTSQIVRRLLQSRARADELNGLGESPLMVAVKSSRSDIVPDLLQLKADPSAPEFAQDGWTPIHYAVRNGERALAELLMQHMQAQLHVDSMAAARRLDAADRTGSTLLHHAAYSGSEQMMERALAFGCDVNGRDFLETTPLHAAAQRGNNGAVQWLLKRRADPTTRNENGDTALDIAVGSACSPDTCRDLRQSGGTLSSETGEWGHTVLHCCTEAGQGAKLKFALEFGGCEMLEVKTNQGCSALYFACLEVNIEAIKTLMGRRADVNSRDLSNRTALQGIIEAGFSGDTESRAASSPVEAAKFLLAGRADLHSVQDDGSNALYNAVEEEKTDIVKLLFEHRADLHRPNSQLEVPACSAAGKQVELTEWFLERGSSIHLRDGDGWTLAHWAANSGQVEILELLLQRQADLSCRTHGGSSVLHLAAGNGSAAACKYLMQQQADPMEKNAAGDSPLSKAAAHFDAMRVLSAGCSVRDLLCLTNSGYSIASRILISGGLNFALWLIRWADAVGIYLDFNARNYAGSTILMDAVNQEPPKLALLIKRQADVRLRDHEGNTALHLATALRGSEYPADTCTNVSLLVEQGAEVNAINIWGSTPFLNAVKGGHLWLAKSLVKRQADVNARLPNDSGALHFAAAGGHQDCLTWLLQIGGSNIDRPNKDGITPFLAAVFSGEWGSAQVLLRHKADLHHEDNSCRNALWWAMGFGRLDHLRWLLQEGVVAKSDICNESPLLRLMVKGPNSVADRFISRLGAGSVNIARADGLTPFAAASMDGLPRVLRALLRLRANASARDVNGLTPLHRAVGHSDSVNVDAYKLLLSVADAVVDAADHTGTTPLMLAAELGRQVAVNLLLDARADPDATDKFGRRPIHYGAGHACIIERLLKARSDLSSIDLEGRSVLVHAVAAGGPLAVKTLLERKVNPVLPAHDGSLAFHYAAAGGHLAILHMLPKFAAPDSDGWSPIYHAAVKGRTMVVNTFLERTVGDGGLTAELARSGNLSLSLLTTLSRVQEAMRDSDMGAALGWFHSFPEWDRYEHGVPVEVLTTWPNASERVHLEGGRALASSVVTLGLPSFGKARGRWHIEMCVFGFTDLHVGVVDDRHRQMGTKAPGEAPTSWTVQLAAKRRYHDSTHGEVWRCPPLMRGCPQRIGIAIDIDAGKLLLTADGTWHTAFDNIKFKDILYPCVHAASAALSFHVKDLQFAPPGSSFKQYSISQAESAHGSRFRAK